MSYTPWYRVAGIEPVAVIDSDWHFENGATYRMAGDTPLCYIGEPLFPAQMEIVNTLIQKDALVTGSYGDWSAFAATHSL